MLCLNLSCVPNYLKDRPAIDNDILNNNNDDTVDGKIELDNQSDGENISKDCKISITSLSHCREKLVTIRNLTYDIHNEDYSVFDKVNEYLESVLYLLRNATIKKDADKFERKRQIVDIPKKRAAKIPKKSWIRQLQKCRSC